jgi:hypothetical protein
VDVGQWGNHLSAKADLFIALRDIGNKRRETQRVPKLLTFGSLE